MKMKSLGKISFFIASEEIVCNTFSVDGHLYLGGLWLCLTSLWVI